LCIIKIDHLLREPERDRRSREHPIIDSKYRDIRIESKCKKSNMSCHGDLHKCIGLDRGYTRILREPRDELSWESSCPRAKHIKKSSIGTDLKTILILRGVGIVGDEFFTILIQSECEEGEDHDRGHGDDHTDRPPEMVPQRCE
jgi:hypothetical protein